MPDDKIFNFFLVKNENEKFVNLEKLFSGMKSKKEKGVEVNLTRMGYISTIV